MIYAENIFNNFTEAMIYVGYIDNIFILTKNLNKILKRSF